MMNTPSAPTTMDMCDIGVAQIDQVLGSDLGAQPIVDNHAVKSTSTGETCHRNDWHVRIDRLDLLGADAGSDDDHAVGPEVAKRLECLELAPSVVVASSQEHSETTVFGRGRDRVREIGEERVVQVADDNTEQPRPVRCKCAGGPVWEVVKICGSLRHPLPSRLRHSRQTAEAHRHGGLGQSRGLGDVA